MHYIDVEKIARSCGLRKSRALSGGVYLCDDAALRAFANAVMQEAAEQDSEMGGLDLLPELRRPIAPSANL